MLTKEERDELEKLYVKHFALLWLIAKWKCGGNEDRGEVLLQDAMALASSKKFPWCTWAVAVAAGIAFPKFMRGIMARVVSNLIKRLKNDPQEHFQGDMTADAFASQGHYDSPEQVAVDKNLLDELRAELERKGNDDAVKCLELWIQGAPECDVQAEHLGWNIKRVYKANEHIKAVALALHTAKNKKGGAR